MPDSGSTTTSSKNILHSPACRPIQRFVQMETENTELAQTILKPSLNTPIAASAFTLLADLRAVVYNVFPSSARLPSPTVGRLFALLTGFTSLSVVLLRLHIILSPGNLKLWQWQWMSSSPLLMLSVVFLLLLSLLLIFPSRLEESLKPRRRRRTRPKSLDSMIPLRIQQSAPVALRRDVSHQSPSLQSHVHAQWTRVRLWAEQNHHAKMLCNRSSAAATFIVAEMQEQLSSPRLQLEFRDLYACTFIAESRLLFRVSSDGVIAEIKRLPMSQPAVLVQSFVNRCWQLNDGSQCFEIVGRVFEESGMVVYSYSSYRNLFGTVNASIRPVIRELLAKLNGVELSCSKPLSAYRCKNFVSRRQRPPFEQIE